MAKQKIKLDHAGMAAMLQSSDMREAITGIAESIGASIHVTAHDGPIPVGVKAYTTDRAAAAVTLMHPAGLGMQAKHGTLTKAAQAAGLKVTAKKGIK